MPQTLTQQLLPSTKHCWKPYEPLTYHKSSSYTLRTHCQLKGHVFLIALNVSAGLPSEVGLEGAQPLSGCQGQTGSGTSLKRFMSEFSLVLDFDTGAPGWEVLCIRHIVHLTTNNKSWHVSQFDKMNTGKAHVTLEAESGVQRVYQLVILPLGFNA